MFQTPEWADRGACVGKDPEMFFADPRSDRFAQAVAICEGCPVRTLCLEWALKIEGAHPEDWRSGVYGALGPGQRARLYRSRRRKS